ncbi:uncharacterized protein LOC136033847 isoform X2 [Artemia franciscana]|uniref:C2H2-type domain-containing protein n=1 Tax=Artemia franciscana TaxID=6661 RepID=A0AA88IN64_ARTSF|nr:hypothetical protein QYM36_002186 [Artemia franciscana]
MTESFDQQLQQYPLFLSLLTDQVKTSNVSSTTVTTSCAPTQGSKISNFQTVKTDGTMPLLPIDTYEDMFQEVVRKFYGENVVAIEAPSEPTSSSINNDFSIILSDYGKDVLDGQSIVPSQGDQPTAVNQLDDNNVDNAELSVKKKKQKRNKSGTFVRLSTEWVENEETLAWTISKIAAYSSVHKVFRCFECGSIGFLARIAEHWLGSHGNIKVFECTKCPYTSAWARCIRMHISVAHSEQGSDNLIWRENHVLKDVTRYLLALKNKIDSLEDTGKLEKKYSCQYCQYQTDRRDLYTRHESIHKNTKPFECFVCSKEFNRADHCKKHFLRMHKDVEYDVNRIRKPISTTPKEDRNVSTVNERNNSAEPSQDSTKDLNPTLLPTETIYIPEFENSFENKGQQLILRKCVVEEANSESLITDNSRVVRDVTVSSAGPTRETIRDNILIRENPHLQQVIRENVHLVRENASRENVYIMRDNSHLVMRDSRDSNFLAIVRDPAIMRSSSVLVRDADFSDAFREGEKKNRVLGGQLAGHAGNQLLGLVEEMSAPKESARTLPPVRELREPLLYRNEQREVQSIREIPELLNLQPQPSLQLLQTPLQVIATNSGSPTSTNQLYQLVTLASLQNTNGLLGLTGQPQPTAIAVQPKTQPGATIHYSPVVFPQATFSSASVKETQLKNAVETLVRNATQTQEIQNTPSPSKMEEDPIQSVQMTPTSITKEPSQSKLKKKLKEKLYSCTYCTWKGVDNWCLKRHLNTHIRPFLCVLCDYKAARSERLSTHMQKVHNKRICTRCSFITNDQESLSQHMKESH